MSKVCVVLVYILGELMEEIRQTNLLQRDQKTGIQRSVTEDQHLCNFQSLSVDKSMPKGNFRNWNGGCISSIVLVSLYCLYFLCICWDKVS